MSLSRCPCCGQRVHIRHDADGISHMIGECERQLTQLHAELDRALARIQQLEDKYEPPESRPC